MPVPDARVQTAVANWGPRLIANGVDYNDFVRTTAGLERWEQWLPAWTATAETHLKLAHDARSTGHDRSAGEAFARAAVCLHFANIPFKYRPLVADWVRDRLQ